MEHIKNKTLIITGASQGIGEATARLFAKLGANVALIARSKEKIEKISTDINSNGGKSIAIKCDVSKPDEVENAIKVTLKSYRSINILIGNAGVIDPIQNIADMDVSDFDKVIDVNIKGVWYGIKAVLPHMKNGGTIITIGSGAASNALEGWSHYCTSKAAVHHLNSCLDLEMRKDLIRALVLSPGTVATEMQKIIKKSGVNPVSEMNWSDHISPDWVAKCLVWMCSNQADDYLGKVVSLREEKIRQKIGFL
ncbi:MAG: SDR family NAD(P)-dependent oxidoreductase [Paracoccaceae bacterium]|nr:SDR family NAD(P)-dependent oxidoreductase [Paracoccaceae bacterium]